MISITVAAGIFGSLIAGALLHEVSHAAAVKLLGAKLTYINWWSLSIGFEIDSTEPAWKDRVIGAAPLIPATMMILVLAYLWPVSSKVALYAACVLVMNTIFVSLQDWELMIRPRKSAFIKK